MDKGGIQINGLENKKVGDNTQSSTLKKMMQIDYMCQEKQEEEDLLALKIVWMYQYKDYIKKSKERLITKTSNSSDSIRMNRRTTKTRKLKLEEKQWYGYFKQ